MLINFLLNSYYIPVFNDTPKSWGYYFQDSASPSFEGIVELHDQIMFYLVIILFGVSYILWSTLKSFNSKKTRIAYKYLNHGTLIELIWTVSPALVLVAIAFPSFKLLYLMDDVFDPAMTVKVVGFYLFYLSICCILYLISIHTSQILNKNTRWPKIIYIWKNKRHQLGINGSEKYYIW